MNNLASDRKEKSDLEPVKDIILDTGLPLCPFLGVRMQERIAVVGIIVENWEMTGEIQRILHDYRKNILGRMGIPHIEDTVNVISLVVKAPQPVISAMTGKLGNLDGVTAKAIYSNKFLEKDK